MPQLIMVLPLGIATHHFIAFEVELCNWHLKISALQKTMLNLICGFIIFVQFTRVTLLNDLSLKETRCLDLQVEQIIFGAIWLSLVAAHTHQIQLTSQRLQHILIGRRNAASILRLRIILVIAQVKLSRFNVTFVDRSWTAFDVICRSLI